MKTIDDYLNLNDYQIEIINNYTDDFIDKIINLSKLYHSQSRELSENYSRERLYFAFKRGKRFEYGYCLVKHKGKLVLSFGIDNFEGWGVVARYLRYPDKDDDTSLFVPFGYGVAFPYVINNVPNIKGLCSVQNVTQRDLMGMVFKRYGKHIKENNLLGSASRLINKSRKLPYTVWYRSHEQFVYVYGSIDNPPFLKFQSKQKYDTTR